MLSWDSAMVANHDGLDICNPIGVAASSSSTAAPKGLNITLLMDKFVAIPCSKCGKHMRLRLKEQCRPATRDGGNRRIFGAAAAAVVGTNLH